jgi:hypothetical protein
LASAQNVHPIGTYNQNQEDVAELKANSCENVSFVTSRLSLTGDGASNQASHDVALKPQHQQQNRQVMNVAADSVPHWIELQSM